jgi:hypothetical protein
MLGAPGGSWRKLTALKSMVTLCLPRFIWAKKAASLRLKRRRQPWPLPPAHDPRSRVDNLPRVAAERLHFDHGGAVVGVLRRARVSSGGSRWRFLHLGTDRGCHGAEAAKLHHGHAGQRRGAFGGRLALRTAEGPVQSVP